MGQVIVPRQKKRTTKKSPLNKRGIRHSMAKKFVCGAEFSAPHTIFKERFTQ